MQRQLDIFDDSRDVVLRNDLAQALMDGNTAAALRAAGLLQAEFEGDRMLAPAAALIQQLSWRETSAGHGRLTVATVLEARQRLEASCTPAARAVFAASDAAVWLAAQWQWLAEQAAGFAWNPTQAEAHPAALFLRAQAWRQMADAVARIDSWRRIPVPLLWMAQARWRADGSDAAWPLLAEALWLAPACAAALIPLLASRELDRLVDRFEERFDVARESLAATDSVWVWLPAFALVDRPMLAGPLSLAVPLTTTPPVQAFQVMCALLRMERQGQHREIVSLRARLQRLSLPLFSAYLSTR